VLRQRRLEAELALQRERDGHDSALRGGDVTLGGVHRDAARILLDARNGSARAHAPGELLRKSRGQATRPAVEMKPEACGRRAGGELGGVREQ
jgi:hypothetical protein